MTPVLEATGVRKTFSGIVAIDNLDLMVEDGERVGLIGPNGAGKTTFFNCVLGVLRADAGCVRLHGEDISRLLVHARARRDLHRTASANQRGVVQQHRSGPARGDDG